MMNFKLMYLFTDLFSPCSIRIHVCYLKVQDFRSFPLHYLREDIKGPFFLIVRLPPGVGDSVTNLD